MAKTKKKTRGKIVKDLDAVFSRYIRKKYSSRKGTVECYTCGKSDERKYMQCAHFISRRYYKYRRDENNCRVCCKTCNVFLKGNYIVYTLKMMDEMGLDRVTKALEDKEVDKIPTWKLEEMIQEYTKKLDLLG